VRITADCPVIDPAIIDKIIATHFLENADYTSNTIDETYPDGLDIEIFTYKSLTQAWNEASLSSEREHVTPYIKKHPDLFLLKSIVSDINYADKRWTLDTELDFEFLRSIFNILYKKNHFFSMNDILHLIKKQPSLEKINSNIIRNEGYLNSLKKDEIIK
jgi:spore coat polysaccharide biosynthesis protein SpsF